MNNIGFLRPNGIDYSVTFSPEFVILGGVESSLTLLQERNALVLSVPLAGSKPGLDNQCDADRKGHFLA